MGAAKTAFPSDFRAEDGINVFAHGELILFTLSGSRQESLYLVFIPLEIQPQQQCGTVPRLVLHPSLGSLANQKALTPFYRGQTPFPFPDLGRGS